MEILYVAWGILVVLFIVMLLALRVNEDKATRRRESAIDPMLRRRPAPVRTLAIRRGTRHTFSG